MNLKELKSESKLKQDNFKIKVKVNLKSILKSLLTSKSAIKLKPIFNFHINLHLYFKKQF